MHRCATIFLSFSVSPLGLELDLLVRVGYSTLLSSLASFSAYVQRGYGEQ
jgi:hypothetical protein